jgi:hypothetical protein
MAGDSALLAAVKETPDDINGQESNSQGFLTQPSSSPYQSSSNPNDFKIIRPTEINSIVPLHGHRNRKRRQ